MTQADSMDIALNFTGERYVPEVTGNIYLEHMHRYLLAASLVRGKDVLDIASGEGFGSMHMAGEAASVVGVDISEEAVAHASTKYRRDNLQFRVGSCAAIPLADGSVDVVVSFETIEHHDQHEQMMLEIKRVLRPGGILIISSPEKREYSDLTAYRNPFHVKELYRSEFTDLLDQHFANRVIYGQRVVFGSGLFLEDGPSAVFTRDSRTLETSPGIQRPLYLIAIASDTPLETLPDSSFFEEEVLESEVVNNEFRVRDGKILAYENELAAYAKSVATQSEIITARDHEIANLVQTVEQLQNEVREQFAFVQALVSSSSWRITRPLRFLRRLASRDHLAIRRLVGVLPTRIANALRNLRRRAQVLNLSLVSSTSNVAALNELVGESIAMCRFASSPMTALLPASDLPDVDISIVTYNSEKWVDGFIASLSALEYPIDRLHLYFVDNSSQDGTVEALRRGVQTLAAKGIDAHVLTRPNLGFGAGHNAGIGAGKSAFCLVTNLDLVFEPDSLARAVSHAVSDEPQAAAWEFRQKPYEHPKNYDPISGATNWNSHACVLLRRSAFVTVGGYCKDLFMYGEDVELSYRLRAAGFHLRFSPHAVVYHYTYETAGELKPLQLTGSTFANLYIRLSYGTTRDMLAVPGMALSLLLSQQRFPGARRKHLKNVGKLLWLAPGLIRKNRARKSTAAFPFNGWDYDFIRKGAFHPLEAMPESCPKVTVITRTYKGREKLLLQAMTSVANQTYPNIEHIVTEDKGEFLKDMVTRFAAETGRDIVYVSGNKIGRSDAGNLALATATGRWCVFLDDDDQFYCDHVEVLVSALLKRPDARAAFALAFEVPTRKLAEDWSSYSVTAPISHEFMAHEMDYGTLKHRNLFPIQAVLFERDLFIERGGFDEDLEALEDWALWQRYAYHVDFAFVPKTTSAYRTPEHVDHFNDRSQILTAAYDALVARMDEWRAQWDGQMAAGAPESGAAPSNEINLLFPIGHFYSPIADPVDIASRRNRIFARAPMSQGINFNEASQLELLAKLKPHVETVDYPRAKPDDNITYFYDNDQYPVLDAEFLYGALCHFRPKTMIEIGSGFSSLITADVNRRILGGALNFICVEPYPRQFLIDGVDGITHLNISKVEDLPLSYFDQLDDGDILFIDSSHVSKVGSDVNYLFFEVIPRLKKGVIVHVHDIFLPDEYPEDWVLKQNRNWNEQYVLQAFLQFNSAWEMIWASHFMGTRHRAAVQDVFPRYPKLGGGGSLWMRRL